MRRTLLATGHAHLALLRDALKQQGLDGFIVPLTDEHMSEYVGDYAQRLKWLTGFDGSAGTAAVLLEKAAVFVDGRYGLQVRAQVDSTQFESHLIDDCSLLDWLKSTASAGAKIGYDPELATVPWVEKAEETLSPAGINLTPARATNPVDSVWHTRPEPPLAKVYPHAEKYTGKSAAAKRADIARELKEKGADSAVITMLDSVAWAFNIRGADVDCTPVPHAFALLHADESATLFIDDRKIDDSLREHLGNSVEVRPRADFYPALTTLGQTGKTVLVDRTSNNAKVFETLTEAGAKLVEGQDPCILMKAIKNEVEQAGTRAAHIRDGGAVSEFLHWLDAEAPNGKIDELTAVARLWFLREKRDLIKDRSFDTISGAGPNGAIVHYRVTEKTNRPLEMNSLYLVDSGGQYLDGTTDITRTIPIGTPTAEMKDRFTRVLKGHIAVATALFPKGTPGSALDPMARRALWDVGLDYDHGTGHGVGSFLAVHEGPQRIAKAGSSVPLEPGMILSNEPGYYKTGEYGIRIENLVLVVPVETAGDRTMYGFETLTFAPIDKRLIDRSLLNENETEWLNTYHQKVLEKIAPEVDDATKAWLEAATAPL